MAYWKHVAILLGISVGITHSKDLSQPSVLLSNGKHIPLMGIGVGNLQQGLIEQVVSEAIDQHGIRLIDTAAASRNEHIIAETLRRSDVGASVAVLTKVWYTHLGFERTMLSVRDSLKQLGRTKLDIVLLHWPRCRPDIPWMRCDQEERDLPERVKSAGPPPGPDAWQDSWRALEQLNQEGVVANIGVSNFDLAEMQQLTKIAKIQPQLVQNNVLSLVFDQKLVNFLLEHNIHFQAYNVFGGILQQLSKHGVNYRRIQTVAEELKCTPTQIVLRWLMQSNVSVVPRSSQSAHLAENSGAVNLPSLDKPQMEEIRRDVKELVMRAELLQNKKVEKKTKNVAATFQNTMSKRVQLFWINPESGEEKQVGQVEPGATANQNTFTGHRFVARIADTGAFVSEFEVKAALGSNEAFSIQHHEL